MRKSSDVLELDSDTECNSEEAEERREAFDNLYTRA